MREAIVSTRTTILKSPFVFEYLELSYESCDPDQDKCTQDCHQTTPAQTAPAKTEQPGDPAASDRTDYPQHNIGNHAVAVPFHDLPGCPAHNQTYDDPPDNPMYHVILPRST